MATKKTTEGEMSHFEEELLILEQKKVKAIERIANSVDALTVWFEEIDKDGWGERLEYYLHEWHKHRILKGQDEEES
jgi:hypothetical protein